MMNTQYYCDECGKGFKNRTMHNCRVYCKICCRKKCEVTQQVTCTDCNKICRSQECFIAHKKKQISGRGKYKGVIMPSLCEQFWQCPDCGVVLKVEHRKSELHECGKIECNLCHEFHLDENHQCYMRALSPEQENTNSYSMILNVIRVMRILNIYPILLLLIVYVMSVK